MSTQIPAKPPAPLLFAVAVFVSASLVFIVQPMIARMILPKLGGSSAVWNTSLAFFQAALLLGYAYAHWLQRLASLHRQMIVHLCVLAAAALVLPLRISGLLGDPSVDAPALWLLAVLALSVGAPFAALSATAPLIQAWFARTHGRGPEGRDPYVLYAASNLGSLLALLAYPVAVEPFTRLGFQSGGWSLGYVAFAVLLAGLVALSWRARDQGVAVMEAAPPVPWSRRMVWMLLAAAPSSLLLGVTQHISADVASTPFLWVIPLALYLVTFILAFRARPLLPRGGVLMAQVVLIPAALILIAVPAAPLALGLPIHLLAFFVTAQICAFALADRRPPPSQLTQFYLWMSVGGVVGGAFNAFVAPLIFSGVWEYPIVLVLAVLARPSGPGRISILETGWLVGALACAAVLLGPFHLTEEVRMALLFTPAICALLLRSRPAALAAALAALGVATYIPTLASGYAEQHRSFFGVVKIQEARAKQLGAVRMMVHGSTLHGTQSLYAATRCQPTTYYAPATPIGQVFRQEQARRPSLTIGAVGLGAGTVAAYVRPTDTLRFFEIDPLVVKLAFDPARFSFVHGCAKGPIDLTLGDARLSLEKLPSASFDLLLIDAFSSDSVPTHLMTVQAMKTYLRLLKPGGIVILHLSNRNLELAGPAAAAMREAGGDMLEQTFYSQLHDGYVETSSQAIIAARDTRTLAPYYERKEWTAPTHVAKAWTDDYTNVAGAIIRRWQDQHKY